MNIVSLIIAWATAGNVSVQMLLKFNGWVEWLLVCYFCFWMVYRFCSNRMGKDLIVSLLIIGFSLVIYMKRDSINVTTWCPEIFGFIWGIGLSNYKEHFRSFFNRNWAARCGILCILALIFGVLYLKFKTVPFFGDYILKIMLGVIIIGFMLSLNVHVKIGNAINLYLGKISYEVYLIHGTVFALIRSVAPEMSSGVFILMSVLVTVVLSAVVHKISEILFSGGRISS